MPLFSVLQTFLTQREPCLSSIGSATWLSPYKMFFFRLQQMLILELLHVRKPFDQLQGHPELIVL